MQHIMMGSALLLLTACHHVKGDEIPPGGEKNIADAISAGGQQGPSNIDDQDIKPVKPVNGNEAVDAF